MPVQFTGLISTRARSEIHPPQGPPVEVAYARNLLDAAAQ
jgi:hypothetical protein